MIIANRSQTRSWFHSLFHVPNIFCQIQINIAMKGGGHLGNIFGVCQISNYKFWPNFLGPLGPSLFKIK